MTFIKYIFGLLAFVTTAVSAFGLRFTLELFEWALEKLLDILGGRVWIISND